MGENKTIVVGIDGAHFELINQWLEGGELPNIKRCIEEGCYADLEVCLPPVTSPNWKCYSTGKNPGKLGIFWWENIDKKNKRVYYPEDRKNKHKEIWDYLSESGQKVFVIGTPTTYPPKEISGIMISGGGDALEKNFTYPPELEGELKEKYDYRVHPKHKIALEEKEAAEEMQELIDLRFKVTKNYMQKDGFDFVQITTFYSNMIQHFLWNSEETKKAWKIMDDHIGDFLEMEDYNLIIMSDHGSNKIETAFNINTWLHEEGYLKYNFKYRFTKFLGKMGVNRQNVGKILSKLNLIEPLKKILPKKIDLTLPSETGEIKREGKSDKIDWERSDAIASGQGPIYILNEEVKDEIKEKLSKIRGPNGKKVLRNIYEKEEIYSGEYMDEAPDLIMDQEKGVHILGGIGKKDVFGFGEKWKAENKKYGLFIAHGPDIKQKGKIENISILDLAPTILVINGIKKPLSMDGNVLTEPVVNVPNELEEVDDSNLENTETNPQPSEIKSRLKDLGYTE